MQFQSPEIENDETIEVTVQIPGYVRRGIQQCLDLPGNENYSFDDVAVAAFREFLIGRGIAEEAIVLHLNGLV